MYMYSAETKQKSKMRAPFTHICGAAEAVAMLTLTPALGTLVWCGVVLSDKQRGCVMSGIDWDLLLCSILVFFAFFFYCLILIVINITNIFCFEYM